MQVITSKDFTRELNKIANKSIKKSRFSGDGEFMRAQSITGGGDYMEADSGEQVGQY